MILFYNSKLKSNARRLRRESTDTEMLLWSHIRRKQICNVQFYRQKPIGNYIVDFYAPSAKLVIEVDGSQHFEPEHKERDRIRDLFLEEQGLNVLRFDNFQVLNNIDGVLEVIYSELKKKKISPPLRVDPLLQRGLTKILPNPPFSKEGTFK